MSSSTGTVVFNDSRIKAKGVIATESIGVGTANPTSNLEVVGNVYVSSNLEVGTANLFVDTVNGNVGIGMTDPGHTLDVVGEMNLRSVSNTASIKYNSNVVTEYTRSKKLIKYPRVAMSQNDESSTTGYVASASNENIGATRYAYKVFDNNSDTQWQMSGTNNSSAEGYNLTSPYDANSNSPTITDNNGNDHTGAWVKLKLPNAIAISSMYIYAPSTNRRPDSAILLGSNDDSTWYVIKGTFTVANQDENTISVSTSSYYTYVMFLVKSLTGAEGQLQINKLNYYGVLEYDPDADGTDVIMRSVPNVPNTDWLEVYYDAKSYSTLPASVNDESGSTNTFNGTIPSGHQITFDDGDIKAFVFPGRDSTTPLQYPDYIQTTLSGWSDNQPHTQSCWFKITSITSFDQVFGLWDVASTNYEYSAFGIYTDSFAYYHYGSEFKYPYDMSSVIGTWCHISAIHTGYIPDTKVYLNGHLLSGSRTAGSGNTLSLGTAPKLALGKDPGRNNASQEWAFHGSIANYRLFNRALTADEVWQLYAYQKEYFEHGNLGMTLKAGRLGIGTSEPGAVLDVRGASKFDQAIDIDGQLVSSFTGQHMCFPDGDMEQGLIVSANKNKYVSLNGIATGSSAIRSDESLPVVSLSNVMNDSSVFGVVHELEKGGTSRLRTTGGINTKTPKIKGDDRAVVNSLGEGAMWVANTNGNLVSGDYITTSNVAGYGQRQDDDLLHNYTVAKITMDCDFNPQELPVQVIKSELDTYGRLQWEDDPSGATEPAYKIRYLDTDGQQTDESNCVHRAAYVGCTYHCG